MALVGVELETLASKPDALTTRPPRIRKIHQISQNRNERNQTEVKDVKLEGRKFVYANYKSA